MKFNKLYESIMKKNMTNKDYNKYSQSLIAQFNDKGLNVPQKAITQADLDLNNGNISKSDHSKITKDFEDMLKDMNEDNKDYYVRGKGTTKANFIRKMVTYFKKYKMDTTSYSEDYFGFYISPDKDNDLVGCTINYEEGNGTSTIISIDANYLVGFDLEKGQGINIEHTVKFKYTLTDDTDKDVKATLSKFKKLVSEMEKKILTQRKKSS